MQHNQSSEAVSINIRAKAKQRDLIDQADSRSEFMLEVACHEAEAVLIDQAFFSVDASTFAQFQVLLDKPLPPTDKLRRLLKKKNPLGLMVDLYLSVPALITAEIDIMSFDSGGISVNN